MPNWEKVYVSSSLESPYGHGSPAPISQKLLDLVEKTDKILMANAPPELTLEERLTKLERKLDQLLVELGKGDKTQIIVVDRISH